MELEIVYMVMWIFGHSQMHVFSSNIQLLALEELEITSPISLPLLELKLFSYASSYKQHKKDSFKTHFRDEKVETEKKKIK